MSISAEADPASTRAGVSVRKGPPRCGTALKKSRRRAGQARANPVGFRRGAALDGDLPDCSDTTLQYLSRHWTTSFRLLKPSKKVTQIAPVSKPNRGSRPKFGDTREAHPSCRIATHCLGRSAIVSSRRGAGLGASGSGGGGGRMLRTQACASAQPSPGGGAACGSPRCATCPVSMAARGRRRCSRRRIT